MMPRSLFFMCVALWVAAAAFTLVRHGAHIPAKIHAGSDADDLGWFITQRSYPYNDIPQRRFQMMRTDMKKFAMSAGLQNRPPLGQGNWTLVGPSNVGGRITAITINPVNGSIYAAAASGGVWKSTDFGTTWENVFNESFSIGSVCCNPSNPDEIYVGTGEANPSSTDTYPGNGIWRSSDGGTTWTNLGMASLGHIGKIVVNPKNPNTIYAAAIGLYRSKTAERGVYKSIDHGRTWNRVLFASDSTGAADVLLAASDTNIVVATTWTYYRTLPFVRRGGIGSAIWCSTNGGASWSIGNGGPENNPDIGRISLAAVRSDASMLYALVAGQGGSGWEGVYRSFDHGRSWIQTFGNNSFSETQVWYNNVIAVDPSNPDNVWAGMTNLYRSTDGGTSFSFAPGSNQVHVDYHAFEYWPGGAGDTIVAGSDGGVFISNNGGADWNKCLNLPITQFYAGVISPHTPYQLFGGSQDNGSVRTFTTAVTDDWSSFYGGDGFYCLVDPTDPHYVYAESQNGYMGYSTDGGGTFQDGNAGLNHGETTNWSVPIALDPNSPKTLYTGTNYLYRTIDNMQSWQKISPDLTYDKGGFFSSLSTIDVSPASGRIVWVGTGDGRVWNTVDSGRTFRERSATLPMRWVSRVTADPESANVAYVAFSGFREYDFKGHLYRTRDTGATWLDIGTSLPDIPINDVIVDPLNESTLYVATDLNVLYTNDLGRTWNVLGNGLPLVPVHDLSLHAPSRTMAAFTHGRSVYTYTLPLPPNTLAVTLSFLPKWNLVSNPYHGTSDSARTLFPSAISPAYGFDAAYNPTAVLDHGIGYWLKFPDGASATLHGSSADAETVNVQAKWNLIGSLAHPIPVSAIQAVGTTIALPVYGYAGGYAAVDSLYPGHGYWIKAAGAGKLVLTNSSLEVVH